MRDRERIINLKEEDFWVEQYIHLRNQYHEILLTTPVNVSETRRWLKNEQVEVIGIAYKAVLLGVALLYLNRNGEIAFFVKNPNRGVGTRLLKAIETKAKENDLGYVWAWVLYDNVAATRTFLKNGYLLKKESTKIHMGKVERGVILEKQFYTNHEMTDDYPR